MSDAILPNGSTVFTQPTSEGESAQQDNEPAPPEPPVGIDQIQQSVWEILKPTIDTITGKAGRGPEKDKQQAERAKSGDLLRIPSGAAKRKDLSFLEGCWRATWVSGAPSLLTRICFDKKGSLVERAPRGTVLGRGKASFDAKGRLIIIADDGSFNICEAEKKGSAALCHNTTAKRKYSLKRE